MENEENNIPCMSALDFFNQGNQERHIKCLESIARDMAEMAALAAAAEDERRANNYRRIAEAALYAINDHA